MGILEVKGVGKRFGGLQALGNVNLSVAEHTVHAIIGPNGAGKSTLLNCLVGKLMPDTGSVTFDGQSVLGRKPHEINQMGISRVFQTPEIFGDLTVIENVLIPCFARRDGAFRMHAYESFLNERDLIEKAEHTLEDVGMIDRSETLHAASMSRGDKRRLEDGDVASFSERKLLSARRAHRRPWRGPTPHNTIDLLKQIRDRRNFTMCIIEHRHARRLLARRRITVLAQGYRRSSRTRRKPSAAIRRSRKPISAETAFV